MKQYVDGLNHLFLPMYYKTTLLAEKYQKQYNQWVGTAPYVLAATAVATACAIASFWPSAYQLYWFEVGETLSVLIILALARHAEWHRKRVDYRLLSERLRAAQFLYIAGAEPEHLDLPPYLRSRHPDHWVVSISNSLTGHLKGQEDWPPAIFEPLKKFVLKEWLEDQIQYYEMRGRGHHLKHRTLEIFALCVLITTLAITVLYASGLGADDPKWYARITFVVSWFPALGAACGGILVHREFERNSYRYLQMAKALRHVLSEAEQTKDDAALLAVLKRAHHLMLREQQGWRLTVGVEPPSPV